LEFSLAFIVNTDQTIADLSIELSLTGTPIDRRTERATRVSNEQLE